MISFNPLNSLSFEASEVRKKIKELKFKGWRNMEDKYNYDKNMEVLERAYYHLTIRICRGE